MTSLFRNTDGTVLLAQPSAWHEPSLGNLVVRTDSLS